MQVKKQADSAEGTKAADDLKALEVKRIKVRAATQLAGAGVVIP